MRTVAAVLRMSGCEVSAECIRVHEMQDAFLIIGIAGADTCTCTSIRLVLVMAILIVSCGADSEQEVSSSGSSSSSSESVMFWACVTL